MQYYSLNNHALKVSFTTAVVQGLAPDRGLYFPESLPAPDLHFIQALEKYSDQEIAYQVIAPFVGDDIPETVLKQIISDTLSFPFPVNEVEPNVYALELFHGPTLAFKDVGARFMAGCLGYLLRNDQRPVTVLVATSGDTGGAVAAGFHQVPGINVVILYPSGKVSTLQEKQLTTLGGNIRALEVQGSFDDCQRMVKSAFLDAALQQHVLLTSANSINVARWLPQMFYYFLAVKQLKALGKQNPVFSVPSGNFGNICAGILASILGLPIAHFIAATNVNDTVPRYLENGDYKPSAPIATLSNAMDVAEPSNFVRVLQLFEQNFPALQAKLSGYAFDDTATVQAMEAMYKNNGYLLDPHGAVGYLGLKKYLALHPETTGVFLETAHPVKFADTAPHALKAHIHIPARVQALYDLPKQSIPLPATDEALKAWLLQQ
ncbi:threonine synthase [Chitinophaga costaii]|uniref:Threonine synthase n=1 Tax=Chitinophaga costaii TaxID=1335309 RepID=A0A1C4CDQ7_9BACT|nr:threonine synthase [Chitinophaga costaii]PUZ27134.1 threonine synthase [Chitinophaga costaii]SCC17134.1 threonine synthase [Chitinophaga costaii]